MPRTKSDTELAVLKSVVRDMHSDLTEIKQDVKRLLIFRAYVWGGAAGISALISFALQAFHGGR